MLKLITNEESDDDLIEMRYMKPFELGYIQEGSEYYNCLVMRTSSLTQFEVINLTEPEVNNCWSENSLLVRLLPAGTQVHMELFN